MGRRSCYVENGDDSLCVKAPGRDILWENSYVAQGNGVVIGTSDNMSASNITYRNIVANQTAYGT